MARVVGLAMKILPELICKPTGQLKLIRNPFFRFKFKNSKSESEKRETRIRNLKSKSEIHMKPTYEGERLQNGKSF
ncbi:hypothetical protein ABD86_07715 [Paenibacillus alvei]|nr:hypothetical protein [Paenibacillus alvei]MBG9743846.1 hypothetical protein [Paenibacillus alvei]